jgi:hypothetical protein
MKGYLRALAGAVGVLLLAACVARPTTAARDEHLRDCLARRGWHADGTPTLARLLRPQGEPRTAESAAGTSADGAIIPSASATKAH